jgi:VRR-NUC domain.
MARTRYVTGRAAARAVGLITKPLESDIQTAVFDLLKTFPVYTGMTLWDFSYAVPNGTMFAGTAEQRAKYMNALKKQGFKPGVSDIVIAFPLHGYHGAYIELKRDKRSPIRDEQITWRARMKTAGYFAEIVVGQDEAFDAVRRYWSGK